MPRLNNTVTNLDAPTLWELSTGISIHPDHFRFSESEMVELWHKHRDEIESYNAKHRRGEPIYVESLSVPRRKR